MRVSPAVEITYYTDPLCSWSWALEPQWRKLRDDFAGQIVWRYRMGGMIPEWGRFHDPVHDVGAPAQMGPHWLHVSQLSGVPIEPGIWQTDPPASSYPACLAVKAAELQGQEAGERYLRRAREAVMLEMRNIARREVLLELAGELEDDTPGGFERAAFERAMRDGSALDAFRADLLATAEHGIGRFPALGFARPNAPNVLLVGYRPYDALVDALERAAPGALGGA